MQIISTLKQAIRSGNNLVNTVALSQLFDLLNLYANIKNPNAAIIYKILVFFLIEKHDNQRVREIMLINFTEIF